jgi:hypothetical protein
MGRLCTVCTHPKRKEIDLALLYHSTSYRVIAREFGVGEDSLQRHERAHLALTWEISKGLHAMLSGNNLMEKLGEWHERMEAQYTKADAAGEIMAAVATARTGIQAIESFAKIGPMSELEARVQAIEQEREKGSGNGSKTPPA